MKIVITGSSGLIGFEAAKHFGRKGHSVLGIDDNSRKKFFGEEGDTTPNLAALLNLGIAYTHFETDIRDRTKILDIYKTHRPDATIHCAAQPSHDLAAQIPFDDFEVNAVGTLNLLEASRRFATEAPFVTFSTNKVYGEAPNELELTETPTRFDYKDPKYFEGIDETMRIDKTLHSLFGVSKTAADLMTQEYGYYFNMPTVCFRASCMTGPAQRGASLHGFLSYLVKMGVQKKPYTIFGYRGKQVRDQIHSRDVIRAVELFLSNPRGGEVYNLGGGRKNAASILECIALLREEFQTELTYRIDEKNRVGDHICYISNTGKLKSHYPSWEATTSLAEMIREIVQAEKKIGVI